MKPEPFAVEVNGPANIITMLDVCHEQGVYPDLAAIRAEAVRTIRYLEALSRGERPKWFEIKGAE